MVSFCSLHQASNAGFGPSAVDPRKCMTISCPNSTTTPMDDYFQQSQWGSNINNSCMKPLADAQVSKQYRCDERWYDWFTVPNYHLGNGYINLDPENPGICHRPCESGALPAYLTDPVDGKNLRFINNDQHLDKCISRADYFGGKYAQGSDYCPLSWIYILNSTPSSLQDLIKKHNNTFAKSGVASNLTTKAFGNNQTNAVVYANNIQKLLPIELNNINIPSRTMQNACNKIETKGRVLAGYQMCSNLMINEKKYYDRFAQSLPPNFANNKVTMMKQACNAVFCNVGDPAPHTINKQPLCFKNVGTFNPSTGENIDKNRKERLKAPQPIPEQSFMYRSIKTALYLALYPLVAYLLYILFTDYLYPNVLLPIYIKIMIYFKYLPPEYEQIPSLVKLTKKLKTAQKQCDIDKDTFKDTPSTDLKNCQLAERINAELSSSGGVSKPAASDAPATPDNASAPASDAAPPAAAAASGLGAITGLLGK